SDRDWSSDVCSSDLGFFQRARYTTDPEFDVPPNGLGNLPANDHVRDREPTARFQHPERFAEHAILVGRQVDHAVRYDHIHARIGQRDRFNLTLEELDVYRAGLR